MSLSSTTSTRIGSAATSVRRKTSRLWESRSESSKSAVHLRMARLDGMVGLPPRPLLRHSVASCDFAKPRGTQLRGPLLRVEIDVNETEAIPESCSPLEVVHCAPVEIAFHTYTVGGCALQLRQV